MVSALDEWEQPREYGELVDAPEAGAEILTATAAGKNRPVATAVGWPLLFFFLTSLLEYNSFPVVC